MQALRKYLKEIDWLFLCFLVIFLNQSTFTLKAAGILFIYAVRPNFKFRLFKGDIPKFYPFIIAFSFLNFFFIHDFSKNYIAAFGVAMAHWVVCILAFHQINVFIQRNGENRISTIKAFTLLNCALSLYQLVKVIRITGKINPYRGLDFPYGLSTGDNIYGVLMQNSLYNVMICSMLVIYFLYRKNFVYCLLALIPVVLVFSNTGTILLMTVLLAILAFGFFAWILRNNNSSIGVFIRSVVPKSRFFLIIPVLILVIIGMSWIISPENIQYTARSIWTKIHQDVSQKDKEKLAEIEQMSVAQTPKHTVDHQQARDSLLQIAKHDTIVNEKDRLSRDYLYNFKGKKLSFVETAEYLRSSPRRLLMGAGPVRFSSLTAQRMCGFDSSRVFMRYLPRFTSKEFGENHMLIIKARRDSGPEYRSSINWPDSIYNQVFGEYGLIGFILLAVFYAGFFLKKFRRLTFGFWISGMLLVFGLFGFLFESFAVVIIYELLMQLDIRHNAEQATDGDGVNAGI